MPADVVRELHNPLDIIQSRLEALLDGACTSTPEQVASLQDELTQTRVRSVDKSSSPRP